MPARGGRTGWRSRSPPCSPSRNGPRRLETPPPTPSRCATSPRPGSRIRRLAPGRSAGVEPLLEGANVVLAPEEVADQVGSLGAAARLQHGLAVAQRGRGFHEALAAERAEQVLGDDERPHVRVVERAVPLEVPEGLVEI